MEKNTQNRITKEDIDLLIQKLDDLINEEEDKISCK